MNINDVLIRFLKNKNELTCKNQKNQLVKFFKYFEINEVKDVLKIKKQDIRNYFSDLKVKNRTKNAYLSHIKSFYAYLVEDDYILVEQNEVKNIKGFKTEEVLPEFLTIDEVKAFLSTIDNEKDEYKRVMNYAISIMFLNTGLRLSELVNINIEDIQRNKIKIKRKTGKERVIVLNKVVMDSLKKYLKIRRSESNALFVVKSSMYVDGNRISPRYVSNFVSKYRKEAKIKKNITPHTFRHTYATFLLQNGVNVYGVQKMLDHKDIKTTIIYLHITDKQKEQISLNNQLY